MIYWGSTHGETTHNPQFCLSLWLSLNHLHPCPVEDGRLFQKMKKCLYRSPTSSSHKVKRGGDGGSVHQ